MGKYCDPKKLDLIVTIGYEAQRSLAPAAQAEGCTVVVANSPQQAAEVIEAALKPGAAILAKGSQNGVFAEEAVKLLLANKQDAAKLVRQSDHWLAVKAQQFPNA